MSFISQNIPVKYGHTFAYTLVKDVPISSQHCGLANYSEGGLWLIVGEHSSSGGHKAI